MWYADYVRLEWQNKFGMPKWYLAKSDDFYGGTESPIFQIWWYDPVKAAEYDEAKKDPSKKIEVGPVEENYWVELDKKVVAGETVKIN
jgi:hypothetical protein